MGCWGCGGGGLGGAGGGGGDGGAAGVGWVREWRLKMKRSLVLFWIFDILN